MKKNFKQQNQTEYRRSINDGIANRYTKINTALIEDPRIDFLQIGIMVYILNQSDSWIVYKEKTRAMTKMGRTRFDGAWAGLIEAGYLIKVPLQGGSKWIVNEDGG